MNHRDPYETTIERDTRNAGGAVVARAISAIVGYR